MGRFFYASSAPSRRFCYRSGAYHGVLLGHRQRQGVFYVPERYQPRCALMGNPSLSMISHPAAMYRVADYLHPFPTHSRTIPEPFPSHSRNITRILYVYFVHCRWILSTTAFSPFHHSTILTILTIKQLCCVTIPPFSPFHHLHH